MDVDWLRALAAALRQDDEATMDGALRAVLEDVRFAVWRPVGDDWSHVHGDDLPAPTRIPTRADVVIHDDATAVLRVGADPTTTRIAVLAVPGLPRPELEVLANLCWTALDRVVHRRAAADAAQRLADNERIGGLGSYDWHVPTDTNRWSDQLYRIYGEEPQSFNASYDRFLSFIHPDDREKVRAIHQRAFETGEPYEMEERIVLADGSERLLWSNGEVVFGPDGAPERFIGLCRDVTEQRAAEKAAAAAERHRQDAAAADTRRRAALELNDAVVQGLTAAMWAAENGSPEVANDLLEQTMQSARAMMDDLLVDADGRAPGPGELRRTAAPAAHLPDADQEQPEDTPTQPSGPRVVIADDAPDVRILLRAHLKALGATVVAVAADGAEAVDAVRRERPDLVLLDLSMPNMDGLEATRAIRGEDPDVRIVIVSGYAASSMEAPSLEAGANAYVEKGHDIRDRLAPFLTVPA